MQKRSKRGDKEHYWRTVDRMIDLMNKIQEKTTECEDELIELFRRLQIINDVYVLECHPEFRKSKNQYS